jgi:hypothetical protein
MTTRILTERVADFADFSRVRASGRARPFSPQDLVHTYIKLEFDKEHENASSAERARGFLSSVARASIAAHRLAEHYGGVLLEVQGSMLHVALPNKPGSAQDYAANLHGIYRAVFSKSTGRVLGWRLAADSGRTLVVAGRGAHGDDSYVSLGKSANRPARHIYEQLELPEDRRSLRRFWLGVREARTERWQHVDMNTLTLRLDEANSIAEVARSGQPQLEFLEALHAQRSAFARTAAPIPPAQAHARPTADSPHTYFGWVMRCDLDGFTSRVEECFDDDQRLQELAGQFYGIMDEATLFVGRHSETLAQLPWAGDNFTAAALSTTRDEYARACERRLVELPLDFDKDMMAAATKSGFGGWAHSVAGGDVHGNASGNVFLGSVVLGDRRFLVGVGEGFGRSAQAFSDIAPKAKEIVVYEPDWAKLDDSYKTAFEPAITVRGEQSSLYRVAKSDALVRILAKRAVIGSPTIVTVAPGRTQAVATRPHFA